MHAPPSAKIISRHQHYHVHMLNGNYDTKATIGGKGERGDLKYHRTEKVVV